MTFSRRLQSILGIYLSSSNGDSLGSLVQFELYISRYIHSSEVNVPRAALTECRSPAQVSFGNLLKT